MQGLRRRDALGTGNSAAAEVCCSDDAALSTRPAHPWWSSGRDDIFTRQSRWSSSSLPASRCRNDSSRRIEKTAHWKSLTTCPTQLRRKIVIIHEYWTRFAAPRNHSRAATKLLVWALMRFGLYLMIAAFIIMGAEVAYALYQLATLVL
jgi:hypothetical protein